MKNKKYYIAYGSNLNLPQMAFRCPTAKVVGVSEIKDYELLFRGSRSRSEVVATFLAVLELCRASVIRLAGSETDCTVRQSGDVPEHLKL